MIIVTLVATLAAAMVWQQWRAVQVEAAERARAQSAWILSGALDFAKRILKEDKKTFTALTEPWATPLAEARISTFLAADKSNADDGPEAFLSGNISDAQARYNLRNLVTADKVDAAAQLATLAALCQAAGVETGIAQRIADGMRDAISGTSAAAGLRPEKVAQLTWLGIDAASIDALQPYVVILPDVTVINVNTASKEVIAAVDGRGRRHGRTSDASAPAHAVQRRRVVRCAVARGSAGDGQVRRALVLLHRPRSIAPGGPCAGRAVAGAEAAQRRLQGAAARASFQPRANRRLTV